VIPVILCLPPHFQQGKELPYRVPETPLGVFHIGGAESGDHRSPIG
jgi:hypothetical protein